MSTRSKVQRSWRSLPRRCCFLLTVLLAAAAGAQGSPSSKQPLLPLSPPLGRIGDVVQPVPEGGVPGTELVVVTRLSGCDLQQALFLARFLLQGAVGAGERLQDWLGQQPKLARRLFGKADRLGEALGQARLGTFREGQPCRPSRRLGGALLGPALHREGRITALQAPQMLCAQERGDPAAGGLWLFARPGEPDPVRRPAFTGAVALAPGEGPGEAACRPKLSAVLFDSQGQARLRYHADWAGAAEVELLGDRCRQVRLRFDAASGAFLAVEGATPGCATPRPDSSGQGPG